MKVNYTLYLSIKLKTFLFTSEILTLKKKVYSLKKSLTNRQNIMNMLLFCGFSYIKISLIMHMNDFFILNILY